MYKFCIDLEEMGFKKLILNITNQKLVVENQILVIRKEIVDIRK